MKTKILFVLSALLLVGVGCEKVALEAQFDEETQAAIDAAVAEALADAEVTVEDLEAAGELKEAVVEEKAVEEIKEEVKVEEKKVEEKKPAPIVAVTSGTISLSGTATEGSVKFTWTVPSGLDTSHGFKLIKSSEPNPTYPGSDYQYLSDAGTRSYVWKVGDGSTYHFRICSYNGNGGCVSYSNDIAVTTKKAVEKEQASSFEYIGNELILTAAETDNGVELDWTQSTSNAFNGYKVVKSYKNSNPYYPNDGALTYIPDRSSNSFTDTSEADGKTWYYRICSLEVEGPVYCGNVVTVTR